MPVSFSKMTIPHNLISAENSETVRVASPGRINLIGEHTDYNDGFVLPTAIDKKIYFEINKNNTQSRCYVYSETYNSGFEFDLTRLKKSKSSWENYILGVVNEIQKTSKKLSGFNCKLRSDLPIGAGISSSAALECGLAAGLNKLFSLDFSQEELAKLSQAAENNFVGSNCGIMDQYASILSKPDHLMLLDCLNLKLEYIPVNFKTCKLLLVNTNVSHNLAESEYNARRKECDDSMRKIKRNYPQVKSPRDLSIEILKDSQNHLSSIEYNRLSFILEENERVLKSAEHIKNGDLQEFGKLMYQSHLGLRDKYEVSCRELDFLVNYSAKEELIYGSRMMGGGFGDCTINLIESEIIPRFEKEVTLAYKKEFGITPECITVVPSGGTEVY